MEKMREIAEEIIRTPIRRLVKERTEYYPKPARSGADRTIPFEWVENKEEMRDMEEKRIDGFEKCEIWDMIDDAIHASGYANDVVETMFRNYEDGHISRAYVIGRVEQIMKCMTNILVVVTDLPGLREEKEE